MRIAHRLKSFTFPVEVRRVSTRTYEAQFVDLPEAFTFGVTRKHALRSAKEVLSAVLQARASLKQPMPKPTRTARHTYLTPDIETIAALSR